MTGGRPLSSLLLVTLIWLPGQAAAAPGATESTTSPPLPTDTTASSAPASSVAVVAASGTVVIPALPAPGAVATVEPAPKLPQAGPPQPVVEPSAAPTPAPEPSAVSPGPVSIPDAAAEAEADADADAAAAQLELRALQEEVGSAGAEKAGREELSVYGFADFTYSHAIEASDMRTPYDSFAIGRFDVYLASGLGNNWRTLAEVRFTYLPNGDTNFGSDGTWSRQDTTVSDYTDLDRPLRWGGIVIERIWLEYMVHPLLTIRAGHWLTHYGIWNVDHGSPVVIGVRRPFVVGENLFPASQTGLEFYGAHDIGTTQFGYYLTVSNGRGPLDTYQDLDHNKAFGARLFARNDSIIGQTTLGVSFYSGRYTDRKLTYVDDGTGAYRPQRPKTLAYDERNWAADLKLEAGKLLVQSEAILSDIAYSDAARPPDYAFHGGPPGFQPDHRRLGVYGLAGYRFDFLGVMPFAGIEYYNTGLSSFAREGAAFWGGINVRPTPQVVLKAQYTYSWFPNDSGANKRNRYNAIDLQAAWSF